MKTRYLSFAVVLGRRIGWTKTSEWQVEDVDTMEQLLPVEPTGIEFTDN